ncbi:MAG: hypothetical protein ABUL77_02450 [Bacteroidota bacterium]
MIRVKAVNRALDPKRAPVGRILTPDASIVAFPAKGVDTQSVVQGVGQYRLMNVKVTRKTTNQSAQ